METTMKKITESTLVPISLVITLFGGVMWLSALWFREEANAQAIAEVKQVIKDDRATLRDDIKHINDKLDKIMERLK
jgi:hypothetical protein